MRNCRSPTATCQHQHRFGDFLTSLRPPMALCSLTAVAVWVVHLQCRRLRGRPGPESLGPRTARHRASDHRTNLVRGHVAPEPSRPSHRPHGGGRQPAGRRGPQPVRLGQVSPLTRLRKPGHQLKRWHRCSERFDCVFGDACRRGRTPPGRSATTASSSSAARRVRRDRRPL